MPYDVSWLIENRVISVRYHGEVTADDVRGQSAATAALVEQGTPPVHVFVDAAEIAGVGIGLGELKSLTAPAMPNAGWMMIVAPNTLYRFVISIAVQFTRGSYKFVGSREEALAFAREHDATLPFE